MADKVKLLVGSYPEQVIKAVGAQAYRDHFGMLCSPRDRKSPERAVQAGVMWAGDNFAFTDWNPIKFLNMLYKYQSFAKDCKFIASPDVVRNGFRTALKFEVWEPLIHNLGYPVALVAQDGIEALAIPWNAFEALFIGGSTQWKLAPPCADLVKEAKDRGKWIHFGRVNSVRRLRYCQSIGCDSVDGSSFAQFTKKTREHLPILQTQQESFKWF